MDYKRSYRVKGVFMKEFSRDCKENHNIRVIENGYIVSGNQLADNGEYHCKDFNELINCLARRMDILKVGEKIVTTTP